MKCNTWMKWFFLLGAAALCLGQLGCSDAQMRQFERELGMRKVRREASQAVNRYRPPRPRPAVNPCPPSRPWGPRFHLTSVRRLRSEPVFGYLPEDLRVKNWGGGSCVIASLCMCANKQGRNDIAMILRQGYSGGQNSSSTNRILNRETLPYAYTTSGDESFLQWASDTGRGAAVTYRSNHMIFFDGFYPDSSQPSGQAALLIDNNRLYEERFDRAKWVRGWQGYGGWAVTLNLEGGGVPAL